MLRLVTNAETNKSAPFQKGRMEALGRIVNLTENDRPLDEWRGLLFVFKLAVKLLEQKIKALTPRGPPKFTKIK